MSKRVAYLVFKRKQKENANIHSQQLECTKKATEIIAWEDSANALKNFDKKYLFLGKYHPPEEF